MFDKKIILNTAIGIILAAAFIFVGWYVIDTRQIVKQNTANISEIVNFINQALIDQQNAFDPVMDQGM